MFGKQFVEFIKKYRELEDNNRLAQDLYVHFGNVAGSDLEKTPYAGKKGEVDAHRDPVGVYVYPMDYVLEHPADLKYGAGAKYLRVLKQVCSEDKVLNLQTVTAEEVENILNVALDPAEKEELKNIHTEENIKKVGLPTDIPRDLKLYESVIIAIKLQYPVSAKGIDTPGGVLFNAIQNNFRRRGATSHKPYRERTNLEQSAVALKAGFIMIKDLAKPGVRTKKRSDAVINSAEPEQAIFLRRDAFKIVDVYQIKFKETDVGSDMLPTKQVFSKGGPIDKLARRIANHLKTEIKTSRDPDYAGESIDNIYVFKPIKPNTLTELLIQLLPKNPSGHPEYRGLKQHDREGVTITLTSGKIPWDESVKTVKNTYSPDKTMEEIYTDFIKLLDAEKLTEDFNPNYQDFGLVDLRGKVISGAENKIQRSTHESLARDLNLGTLSKLLSDGWIRWGIINNRLYINVADQKDTKADVNVTERIMSLINELKRYVNKITIDSVDYNTIKQLKTLDYGIYDETISSTLKTLNQFSKNLQNPVV